MSAPVEPRPAAFDPHAAAYDQVAEGDLGVALRARVHAALSALITADSDVLDLGCGTGIDAAWLAPQVRSVVGVEPSPAMAAIAGARCDSSPNVSISCASPEDIATGHDRFDVVLANFGVVNCLAPSVLRAVCTAACAPGGHLVLVSMPRTCPFELVAGAATRNRALRTRRRDGVTDTAGYEGLHLRYLDHRDLSAALVGFELVSVESLGSVLPTFDYRHLVEGRTRLLRLAAGIDRLVASPLGRLAWGDHLIVTMRARP